MGRPQQDGRIPPPGVRISQKYRAGAKFLCGGDRQPADQADRADRPAAVSHRTAGRPREAALAGGAGGTARAGRQSKQAEAPLAATAPSDGPKLSLNGATSKSNAFERKWSKLAADAAFFFCLLFFYGGNVVRRTGATPEE